MPKETIGGLRTDTNYQVAQKIMSVLDAENCTVGDATKILDMVAQLIGETKISTKHAAR